MVSTAVVVLPRDDEPSPEATIEKVGSVSWVFYAGEPIVELGKKKGIDNVWVHPEPGFKNGRCKLIKKDGTRCRKAVRPGNVVCRHHGAGGIENPGGRPPVTGRYSKFLPIRYQDQYAEFMNDPDTLSLRSELALLGTRIGEILENLDTNNSDRAWAKVRLAYTMVKRSGSDDETMLDVMGFLEEALESEASEKDIWDEAFGLIEQRRKVADTERRRIVDAHQYLSYSEANAMIAYVVDTVMKYVDDPHVKRMIAEQLRVFSERGGRVL